MSSAFITQVCIAIALQIDIHRMITVYLCSWFLIKINRRTMYIHIYESYAMDHKADEQMNKFLTDGILNYIYIVLCVIPSILVSLLIVLAIWWICTRHVLTLWTTIMKVRLSCRVTVEICCAFLRLCTKGRVTFHWHNNCQKQEKCRSGCNNDKGFSWRHRRKSCIGIHSLLLTLMEKIKSFGVQTSNSLYK